MKIIKIVLITIGFFIFLASAFLLFEPGNDPTGFFAYTPSIAIMNINNNVEVNDNLEVEFITRGTKDLEITAAKGDVEFLGLGCDGETINFDPSRSINYPKYNCRKNSKVVVKILSGEVEVDINFGGNSQIAKNSAS